MFDPIRADATLSLEDKDLARLPSAEDNLHEYKSSRTKDNELAEKIGKAASGFWNSGGGLFVAGVDGGGRPDGGIPLAVGRQSRRDWIDQIIHLVSPAATYFVNLVEDKGSCPAIHTGRAVVFVGFAHSEVGPHMAPDQRYYVRAGAHTEPASHFLVEGIRARRYLTKPSLVFLSKLDWYTSAQSWMTVEIVTLTSAPVLNAYIHVLPWPGADDSPRFPLQTPIIDSNRPYSFRFRIPNEGFTGRLVINYTDVSGSKHEVNEALTSATCLAPAFRASHPYASLVDSIDRLNLTIRQSRH